MSKVTVATVNKELKRRGIEERLCNGNGYFYFYNGTAHTWNSCSVYGVCYANELTVDQWIEEYYSLKGDK
jgi:hypothetical protein